MPRRISFWHPDHNRVEPLGWPFGGALVFGPFYFFYKRMWTVGAVQIVAVPLTLGLAWVVMPFFAEGLLRAHLRRSGWVEFKS